MSTPVPDHPTGCQPIRLLGRGAEGEVHLVREDASGEFRALKVVTVSGDAARARLEREFEVLVRLRHPNLVAAHDFGRLADGRVFLVLDHVAGGTLRDQPLPASPEVRDAWVSQLLEALDFLHTQGLLHLDLKPQNLLFESPDSGDGPPRLRLADFGLCGRLGEAPRRAGTPGYVAPEVLRGEASGPRADLYAVGALVYEMAVGRPCFSGAMLEDVLAAQQLGQWDRAALEAAAPELTEVLEQLLAPAPEFRPGDVAELRRLRPAWARGAEAFAAHGEILGRDPELSRVLGALQAEPPRNVRLTGPRGCGRSSLLRAVYARLKLAGAGVRLLSARSPGLAAGLDGPRADLLLLDDVHLLDPEGLAALRACLAGPDRPRAVLAALDEALPGAEARALLREHLGRAVQVSLGPLPPQAVRDLLERTFPGHGRPDLLEIVSKRSGGQPGAILQWTGLLTESGCVRVSGGRVSVDTAVLGDLRRHATGDPLAVRLQALPEPELAFLWVAAWLGEEAARERRSDFDPPLELPAALAGPRAWLRERERLREALREVLPPATREKLAGEALEFAGPLPALERAALAAEAQAPDLAREALLGEARALGAGGDHAGAARVWREVLKVLPQDDTRWPLLDELLAALARVPGIFGRIEELEALEQRVQGPLEEAERPELLRRLGWCRLHRGDVAGARAPLDEAFRSAAGDRPQKALVLADLGWLEFTEGRYDLARQRYEEGLELAPPPPHPARHRLLNRLGAVHWRLRAVEEAERCYREAARLAAEGGEVELEVSYLSNLALVIQDAGRLEESIRLNRECIARLVPLAPESPSIGACHQRLAMALTTQMRFRDALEEARRAVAQFEVTFKDAQRQASLITCAVLEHTVGRPSEAEETLAGVAAAPGTLRHTFLFGARGDIARMRGQHEAARRWLARCFRARVRLGEPSAAAGILVSLLELSEETGDRAAAERWSEEAGRLLAQSLGRHETWLLRVARAQAWLLVGLPGELEAELLNLESELEPTELTRHKFGLALVRGRFELGRGRLEEASRALSRAGKLLPEGQAPLAASELTEWNGALLAARGKGPEARARLAEAAQRYRALGSPTLELRALRRHFESGGQAGADSEGLPSELLLELADLVHSIQSLDLLLDRAMDLLLTHLPAERCVVLLASAPGGPLAVAAARGGGESVADEALRVSTTVVRRVAESGLTVVSEDVLSDPELRDQESVLSLSIKSVLCQPLTSRDQVIGAVYLDHRARSGAFDASHRRLLHGFTRLIAGAITQARTRAELARAQELLSRENRELRRDAGHRVLTEPFVCESPAMRRVVEEVSRAAPHPIAVLLAGESGTGKERLAQLVHYQSPRADSPFARFNCAAVPQGLMESEMFGIEAGTASGVGPRVGIFEYADGGTLFLDEIGDMDPVLQAKLLRVLQDGEVRRVGGREPIHVDVRLVSATHRDLREMVTQGTFREDLYFRIAGVALRVPPLRERPEDILPLAEHFLAFFSEALRVPRPQISPAFREHLMRHRWRGNVRELRNLIERELVMQSGAVLMPPRAAEARGDEPDRSLAEQVADTEAALLKRTLEAAAWNQSLAARALGISEQAVRYKMRKYGLRRPT